MTLVRSLCRECGLASYQLRCPRCGTPKTAQCTGFCPGCMVRAQCRSHGGIEGAGGIRVVGGASDGADDLHGDDAGDPADS